MMRFVLVLLLGAATVASAKTVAEEANLSKTRFLAAASHDILQPLNAAPRSPPN